ncbi:hypothetical protein B0H17DRAFT_1201810 [Mycena rosella]|uniref:DUF6532 domain-containing protein n=1 Tax=Mycena rosella TaxID=1033263 RepID=A0AAD7DFX4_MYCRO|nr:hypothetical protein B0H17DRAFT_1201810 [Mycena rosella]
MTHFTTAQFDANLPPAALGRGRREVQFTAARKEHDESRNKDRVAGAKRTETRRRNAATKTAAGNQPGPRVTNDAAAGLAQPPVSSRGPVTAPRLPHRPAETPRSSGPSTAAPPSMHHPLTTPRQSFPATPTPNVTHMTKVSTGFPPPLRLPLQMVATNPRPSYTDFSQLDTSPTPSFPSTTPATQRTPTDMDWLSNLTPSMRVTLLASLRPTMLAPSQWNSMVPSDDGDGGSSQLETFDDDQLSIGETYDKDHVEIPPDDAEAEPSWSQNLDDNEADDDGDHSSAGGALECTMWSIEPLYQRKRKRRAVPQSPEEEDSDSGDDSSKEETGETDIPPKKKKSQKSRSIAVLPADHQRICEAAFDKLKIELTLHKPFPVGSRRAGRHKAQTDEFSELILRVWTNTAFDLDLPGVKPTPEDIKLIRLRVPQFRSGVKVTARLFVATEYGLVDVMAMPNPTPERIKQQIEKNRARVQEIIKTYVHEDPDNVGPETMFRHIIFQHIFTGYWFGSNDNDRAFYFNNLTQVALVTLALIICAARCAIDEWSTGRFVNKKFSHENYFKTYQSILTSLKVWKKHSETQVEEHGATRNLTTETLQGLLYNARLASDKPEGDSDEEEEEEEDPFGLNEIFASVASSNPGPA